MLKKFILISLLSLFTTFLVGCTNDSETQDIKASENQPSEKVEIEADEEKVVLDKLKKEFPDAVVYNDAIIDIDKDGLKENILIFETNKRKVNIGLYKDKGLKGVSIGEGEGYSFEYVKNSLQYEEASDYIIITLHDDQKGLTVDYKITVEYNEGSSETNFIVESFNERQE